MPFGLCNAPATFERLMETVLKGLTFEACLIYLDDVIIGGRTFEEHLQNIRKPDGYNGSTSITLTSDIVKAPSHGNADALSRRPCPENCRHCSRVETKYDYAIRQITTSTATPPDPWSDEKVREDQMADPDIKPPYRVYGVFQQ
ncbi:retrovirus-related Pol polyprotein from transposon 297 [Trichonephila clavipes]|nr:retrovirus-related Pol polyprotein from transposon 297 [Trichonephila clavipes]